MPKSIAIISDIHLSESNESITKSFISYITNIAPMHDELYILGDLFDSWIGDDNNSEYNKNIIGILNKLGKKTKVYFIAGNRDFLIGNEFCAKTGIKLLPSIALVNANNKKFLLTHGDLLLTKDKSYQLMRKVFQNKVIKSIFLRLPLSMRKKMASKARSSSKKLTKTKDFKRFEVDRKYLYKLQNMYKPDFIVYGHIHKTTVEYVNSSIAISIPDWRADSGAIELNIHLHNSYHIVLLDQHH